MSKKKASTKVKEVVDAVETAVDGIDGTDAAGNEDNTENTDNAVTMDSVDNADNSSDLEANQNLEGSDDMDYKDETSTVIFGEDGVQGGDFDAEGKTANSEVLVEPFVEADFEDTTKEDDATFADDPTDRDASADLTAFGNDDATNGVADNSEATTNPASDDDTAGERPTRTRQRRQRAQPQPQSPPEASILTLEVGGEVVTQKDRDDAIWHEIKSSQVRGTHLTGSLGKVESLESGSLIAVIDFKGQRIAIPLNEMMITLDRPAGQSDAEYNERVARVLNRMMGADIDFVVRGITGIGENRAAVASRKAAMLRLRRRYYLTNGTNGKPQVYPDRIVEARIVAVSELAIRVEVFGVETSIRSRDLSWGYMGDARDVYFVGDSVQVRVTRVNGDAAENLSIRADIKSTTIDNTREKLMALKPQTNCMGKVTDVRQGVIFINLVDGVRAISHKCFDHRKPGRGDDVLFVVTRIDEETGAAIGIVSRIVKRNI